MEKTKVGTVSGASVQGDQCVRIEVALDDGGYIEGEQRPEPGTTWAPGFAEQYARDVIGRPFTATGVLADIMTIAGRAKMEQAVGFSISKEVAK